MNFSSLKEITYGVSDKGDGNLSFVHGEESQVINNRRNFLLRLGVKLEDCVVMKVEHQDEVAVVDESYKGRGALKIEDSLPTEALVTNKKGVILFLLTADCFPISFYDPIRKVVALAHLGWQPTDKELITKVINVMSEQFGTHPADLLVEIGPGIHKESYKFSDLAQKRAAKWTPFLEDLPTGETAVDLIAFNKERLIKNGVLEENITINPRDTNTADNLYSHYRSIRTAEPEGRFATVIGLKS